MENLSKAHSVGPLSDKPVRNGWFGKTMNFITFGYWNKLTPRERAIWCTSWNISSWVTVGQMTGGVWLWTKLTATAPWLLPLLKSVWAKVVALLSATKAAADAVF